MSPDVLNWVIVILATGAALGPVAVLVVLALAEMFDRSGD